ncbi:hypothetical protein PM082_015066 [Marasmius tenuissimus]|nr:hypothetical protein PM082_015066 [Marasmius tenuissimus]
MHRVILVVNESDPAANFNHVPPLRYDGWRGQQVQVDVHNAEERQEVDHNPLAEPATSTEEVPVVEPSPISQEPPQVQRTTRARGEHHKSTQLLLRLSTSLNPSRINVVAGKVLEVTREGVPLVRL